MGGRALTRREYWLERFGDRCEEAWSASGRLASTIKAFVRWAWLRATGKTAYRFAPMYETKIDPVTRDSHQANGMIIPFAWKDKPHNTCDWREAILEAFAAAEKKDP